MKHIRKVHVYGIRNPLTKEISIKEKENNDITSSTHLRHYTPQIQKETITQYAKVFYKDNNSFDLVNTRSESYEILHWYYTVSDHHIEEMQHHLFNESHFPKKNIKLNEFEIKLIKSRKPTRDEIIRVKYKYCHHENKIKKEEYNLKTIKDEKEECEQVSQNDTSVGNNINEKERNDGMGIYENRGGCVEINSVCHHKCNKGSYNDKKGTNVKNSNCNVNGNINVVNKKGNSDMSNKTHSKYCNVHTINVKSENRNKITNESDIDHKDKKLNSRNHSKEDKQCQVVQNDINDAIGINSKQYQSPHIKIQSHKISNAKYKSPPKKNATPNNNIAVKTGKAIPPHQDKIEIRLKKSSYVSPPIITSLPPSDVLSKELKRTCPCHRHLDSSNYSSQYQQHPPKNVCIRLHYSQSNSQEHTYQIKVKLPQHSNHYSSSSNHNFVHRSLEK